MSKKINQKRIDAIQREYLRSVRLNLIKKICDKLDRESNFRRKIH